MKKLRITFELQRAVLMHMIKNHLDRKEKDNLRMIFDAIDEEKDGEIELDEFVSQLEARFGLRIGIEEVQEIMKVADMDFDGKMQFSEFLIAGCNKPALITSYTLQKVFNAIDHDGDGLLSQKDISMFLGTPVDEHFIQTTLVDCDLYDGYSQTLSIKQFS